MRRILTISRHKIGFVIKQILYYLGYALERIPEASQLVDVHEQVRRYQLKKLAEDIRKLNDQRLYNKLLKKYIVDWHWNEYFTSSEFIGHGSGEGNLDVYRKVCIKGKYYFEKVYFNTSHDLLAVEWFYEHISPRIGARLKTVNLHKVIKGDLITVVYFDFISLAPLAKFKYHSRFFNIAKNLYEISRADASLIKSAQCCVKDYRLHFHYIDKIEDLKLAIKKMSNNRLTVEMIEQIIDLQPLIFSHGDIYHPNVFEDNYLIDWDSCGFFPHGFDCAFILATNIEYISLEKLIEILNDEFKELVGEDHWDGFQLCCWYFYLMFTVREQGVVPHNVWQEEVYNMVELLYSKTRNEVNV